MVSEPEWPPEGPGTGHDTPSAQPDTRGAHRYRPVRWLLALAAGSLIVAGVLAASHASSGSRTNKPGAQGPAPAFTVQDLRDPGASISLASLRGHPVVLNFFASWCIPCQREMPALEATHRALGERVTFLGLDSKDTRDDGVALLRQTGIDYRAGFDASGNIAADYGLFGMPTTVLIDSAGNVVERHTGEITAAQLQADLLRLFPEPSAP